MRKRPINPRSLRPKQNRLGLRQAKLTHQLGSKEKLEASILNEEEENNILRTKLS